MAECEVAAALFFQARGPQRGSRVGVACVDRDRQPSPTRDGRLAVRYTDTENALAVWLGCAFLNVRFWKREGSAGCLE